MEMDTVVALLKIKEAQERYEDDKTEAVQTVWGAVKPPSASLRIDSANIGTEIDLIVHLWRSEFEQDDFNYIEIDNVRYRIESSNAGINDLYVKLLVSRR